ncbi:MAG: hypothetical protein Q9214_004705 [Letrouitia sp. 1 TL-2023]
MARILTVFGATGAQGSSLVSYVLSHPSLSSMYSIRGVTRDPSKPAARVLQEKGVEVVRADADDPPSVQKAVAGSYAVFSMTNFWEKASAAVEISQGKGIAEASVAAGVKLLIWSSLPDVAKMSEGRLTSVHHFDSKATVEAYIRTLPITSAFFMPACYMQNMQTASNGELQFSMNAKPDTLLPLIDISDTGKYLAPILLEPEKHHHRTFTAATAFYSLQQIVETWSQVTGRIVTFVPKPAGSVSAGMTPEMIKVQNESAGLIKDYQYYGPTGPKDLEWTLDQIKEPLTTWEEFVKKNEPWF